MIKKIYAVYRREGVLNFTKFFIIQFTTFILGLPIALGIAVISPWIQIRLIKLFSERIGHFALNTELLLCARDFMLFPEAKYCKLLFYTVPGSPICNTQLLRMWKRVIWIFPFPYLWYRVDKLLILMLGNKYKNDSLKKTFEPAEGACDRWNFLERINNCHLSFTLAEKIKGEKLTEKLGIPLGSKFVCLLGRDSLYLQTHLPTGDWSYHDYRDVDINNYRDAIDFLTENGYYVVRMGKYAANKFEMDNSKLIDYANHELRSDFMDIYLTAHCFFFISPRSGIDAVAQIFRRPLLLTNFPLCDFKALYFLDLIIPKKIIDSKSGRLLTFSEMCWQIDRKQMMKYFAEKGWLFIENSPEELVAVTQEMLMRLLNTWQEPEDNPLLQKKFWENIPVERQNSSYNNKEMRVGDSFIRKHQLLLENNYF